MSSGRKMEITLADLIALGIICLIGTEGRDWEYYPPDPEWFELHILIDLLRRMS